ncbi:hypothetical protein M0804_015634 [Polistes exclamans]|nr:hypothetical protein M0804_015634 [Polistes exclamans]
MFGDADKKVCGICDDALECATLKVVSVRERDLRSFITKSKEISDRKWKIWSRHTSVLVHDACRVWYLKATIKNVAAEKAKLKASSAFSARRPTTSGRLLNARSRKINLISVIVLNMRKAMEGKEQARLRDT